MSVTENCILLVQHQLQFQIQIIQTIIFDFQWKGMMFQVTVESGILNSWLDMSFLHFLVPFSGLKTWPIFQLHCYWNITCSLEKVISPHLLEVHLTSHHAKIIKWISVSNACVYFTTKKKWMNHWLHFWWHLIFIRFAWLGLLILCSSCSNNVASYWTIFSVNHVSISYIRQFLAKFYIQCSSRMQKNCCLQ